jgi:hypothetical protein
MSDVRYAIEQRLRFIDFLVAHYGSVNRAALVDYFGISLPQASHDIGDYMKIAAENIVYDGAPILSACMRRRTHRLYRIVSSQ